MTFLNLWSGDNIIASLSLIFWDGNEKHFAYACFDKISVLRLACWNYVFLFVVWDLRGKELMNPYVNVLGWWRVTGQWRNCPLIIGAGWLYPWYDWSGNYPITTCVLISNYCIIQGLWNKPNIELVVSVPIIRAVVKVFNVTTPGRTRRDLGPSPEPPTPARNRTAWYGYGHVHYIQCGAVITRSIFSKILTKGLWYWSKLHLGASHALYYTYIHKERIYGKQRPFIMNCSAPGSPISSKWTAYSGVHSPPQCTCLYYLVPQTD